VLHELSSSCNLYRFFVDVLKTGDRLKCLKIVLIILITYNALILYCVSESLEYLCNINDPRVLSPNFVIYCFFSSCCEWK